ncbi:hypothetical protein SAMN02787118_14516 [Streptomyces mirabilis]|uniref:Uncharacterized protein n=1 Tax=Streptomyces mirabilis TaxID=68239 RepID=A0A1I2XDA6_9ACTN|nr:hypothetical protein SAMN02787118_14516 [Streptomyces mirabilis]
MAHPHTAAVRPLRTKEKSTAMLSDLQVLRAGNVFDGVRTRGPGMVLIEQV